jgi:hypothetical protein
VFDSKAKLDAQTFDSIDAMIRAYAEEAVLVARQRHRVLLDYTAASVEALERLIDGQSAVDLDFPVPLVAQLLRRGAPPPLERSVAPRALSRQP